MKKVLALMLAMVLVLSLAACGQGEGSITETTTETTTTTEKPTKPIETTEEAAPTTPAYIGERTVEYHKEDDRFIVFFALQDENKNYMAADGTANIKFFDNSQNVLYDKSIDFTVLDFTEWSNTYRDGTKNMCGIYIDKKDIKNGISDSGVVSLSVVGDGFWFEEYNMNVDNLPKKELTVKLPSVPCEIINYGYDGSIETKLSVESVDYSSEIYDYNGKATVRFSLKVKLLENHTASSSTYSQVGYKLKDSTGLVVDSSNVMVNSAGVGETVKAEILSLDLDPNETFTLTFENTK